MEEKNEEIASDNDVDAKDEADQLKKLAINL